MVIHRVSAMAVISVMKLMYDYGFQYLMKIHVTTYPGYKYNNKKYITLITKRYCDRVCGGRKYILTTVMFSLRAYEDRYK